MEPFPCLQMYLKTVARMYRPSRQAIYKLNGLVSHHLALAQGRNVCRDGAVLGKEVLGVRGIDERPKAIAADNPA